MAKSATSAAAWRAGYGPDAKVQRVRPAYSRETIRNPHRGTATFGMFDGDPLRLYKSGVYAPPLVPEPHGRAWHKALYPESTVAYFRWRWAQVEPEKGKFNWKLIDDALAGAARHGQTLQIRTMPHVSGDDGPAWYWALGGKVDQTYLAESGNRFHDHNDPLYLKHWGDHVRALGRRYDGHPNLECVDIGYGGSCGECGGNATCQTARRLVDIYLGAFRQTQLLSMVGTPGCAYAATVKGRRIGWRGDCYGDLRNHFAGRVPSGLCWDHTHDEYPKVVAQEGVRDAWQTAPVNFETCWNLPHWYEQGWDIDTILEQGYKYHCTIFMPKSFYVPQVWWDKIVEFDKRLGYRFHLHQMILPLEATAGQRVEAQVTIDNKGVAPIYRPYRFALRFSQGRTHHVAAFQEDIRGWLPDFRFFRETFTVPRGLRPGTAKVSCAIVNAALEPVVKLAIHPPAGKDGWHELTCMDITER